jgi:glycosyltransferase involved in cell wall biosynthesis
VSGLGFNIFYTFNMSDKLVSIIIPSYNDSHFVEDAINSALNQTYQNVEIIVVNDGSKRDQDIEFFKTYKNPKVNIINTENKGLPSARNTGIENSNGEFFIPLDADDKLSSTFISETLEVISENEKIGVVYTDQQFFGESSEYIKMLDFDFVTLLSQDHISVASLIRRKAFDQVKAKNGVGYNPNMKFGYEDWDLWLSLSELGWEFKCLHKPLFLYRKHGVSMSTNTSKKHEYLITQLIENHEESFSKNYKQVIINLQKLYKDRELFAKDINRNLSSPVWLVKRLIATLIGKNSKL